MLKRNFSLLLFLTLLSLHGYSDFKLFPGYYIRLNGDSVRCNIDFRDWRLNPKTIRVQVNNEMHELSTDDIRGFGVDGYNDYLSATVSHHIGPVAGSSLPADFPDSVVTEKCFLQVLESGRYSLYSLVLPERSYFFTGYADTVIHELIYRVKQKENAIEEDPAYKKEIFSLFAKEGIQGQYVNRINRAAYNVTDIQPLFRILDGRNAREKSKKKSSGDFRMSVFAGAMMYTFPSSVDGEYAKANHFDPAFSPVGGVDFLYSLGGKFGAIKFGLSLGYSGYSGKIDRSGTNYYFSSVNYNDTVIYQETLRFSGSLLTSKWYVMYLINPLGKIKAYIKGGANLNISLKNNNDIYTKSTADSYGLQNGVIHTHYFEEKDEGLISIKNSFLSVLASIGIIDGRHKFELSWSPNFQAADKTPKAVFYDHLYPFKLGSYAIYYYYSLFPGKAAK